MGDDTAGPASSSSQRNANMGSQLSRGPTAGPSGTRGISPGTSSTAPALKQNDAGVSHTSTPLKSSQKAIVATPTAARPFPMSPPSQSVMLDQDELDLPPAIESDDDELPSVLQLSQRLAHTQPSYTTLKGENPESSISAKFFSPPKRSQSQRSPNKVPYALSSPYIISIASSPASMPKNRSRIYGSQKRKQDDGDRSFAASEQPAKRQKIKAARRPTTHKHHDHWELDGNVVIRIKNTLFRVHRGVAKHSKWLSERFEEEPDEFEGKDPVFDVGEDNRVTVKDFEALLDAMDMAITYCYNPPDFSTVASIYRASKALSFDRFLAWATRYLEEMWPSSLCKVTLDPISHASDTVILAREWGGLKSIRKRALYELVRLAGFGQDDDSDDDESEHGRTVISPSDYRLLVRAREMLTSAWTTRVATATFGVEGGCAGGCTAADVGWVASRHQEMVVASGLFETFLRDPVCGTRALMELDWAGVGGYCGGCVERRGVVWGKARERMWEDLDVWLGLDKC
ncbi:hypothetical protein IW261DRAFT_1392386 [Armillaria novae-zelandiae]|uniref:BTB domain-containing protein n=1 Tax=Armillaria novae-zelandiae TaxID=153914 RepID=A0AA39UG22_9AGAR|nr:hypothetical protein IW261DRAFT_1392386 [Armillaria novae-zelandiae]